MLKTLLNGRKWIFVNSICIHTSIYKNALKRQIKKPINSIGFCVAAGPGFNVTMEKRQ